MDTNPIALSWSLKCKPVPKESEHFTFPANIGFVSLVIHCAELTFVLFHFDLCACVFFFEFFVFFSLCISLVHIQRHFIKQNSIGIVGVFVLFFAASTPLRSSNHIFIANANCRYAIQLYLFLNHAPKYWLRFCFSVAAFYFVSVVVVFFPSIRFFAAEYFVRQTGCYTRFYAHEVIRCGQLDN